MDQAARAETDRFKINQIHARVHSVIREATERFAQRSNWKKHLPWLVSSIGEALGVAHAFVYKNYPDKDDILTAVRLYRWSNPLHLSRVQLLESRVTRYTGPYLEYLRDELSEHRPVLSTRRNPLPPLREYMDSNAIERIVVVPLFAGADWWGFFGAEDSRTVAPSDPFPIESVSDILRTISSVVGESIRGAALDQALRFSEQLQRIQKDIALTVNSSDERETSLNELLELICELGEFDAGAIDLAGASPSRIAQYGEVPIDHAESWCENCRPGFGGLAEPIYGDASIIQFCGSTCPVYDAGYHSYAVVPILHNGQNAATLSLFSSHRSVVPPAVRKSIEAIGSEIGTVVSSVGGTMALGSHSD